MPIATGTSFGRYEIRSHLGAGGMGEVYLAQDTKLERTVALKLLPPEVASDPQRMHRFMQEARAASALNHPNIITIHEIGEADSTHFIATEFIDGVTLRLHMAGAQMSLLEALDVAVQVAHALAAAHTAGIVHRDVKPENIMLRRDGYVKVLDFGLAKPTERQASLVDTEAATKMLVNTSPGMVMGTVSYMSPEQARGYTLDERTDIWSLGVVLYEMVTGHSPFAAETTSDVLVAVLDREPAPLADYLPDVPAELQRIVRKALRKDKEERYQTIKDMLVDLRGLKQELEFEAKLERSLPPESRGERIHRTSSGQIERAITAEREQEMATRTSTLAAARRTASPQYPSRADGRRKWLWALALAALGLAMLIAVPLVIYRLVVQKHHAQMVAPFREIRISRITTTGKSIDAAISPDGKLVAHIVSDGSLRSLRIKQVATSQDNELVPPDNAPYTGVTFSRDGNYVYFVKGAKNQALSELYQVSVLGGEPRKLITDVDTAVTFSPDGKRMAFMRNEPIKKEIYLMVANADGTGERILVTRKDPDYIWRPSWSPDGKSIACVVKNSTIGSQMSLAAVSVDDGSEQPLTAQRWREIRQLSWLPNGSGLALVAATDEGVESSQLWFVSQPGGEARRITNDLNFYQSLSVAADSGSLVTVQANRLANIWIAPGADAARARQITSGTSFYYGLAWTPDGRIVYTSNANGTADIWIMNNDGSNQKQLTVNAGANVYPSVSPDGRYIVFTSDRVGAPQHHIWRIDTNGGNPKQLTNGNKEFNPQFSPDGKWVVYTSWDAGKPTIWKIPVDGGSPVQLTQRYSENFCVSPDGKLVAAYYWDEQFASPFRLALIPIEGGEPIKTLDLPAKMLVRWSTDGRSLIYSETRGGVSNLWSQPIAGGQPKQITDWKQERIFDFAWSTDGKQLAASRGIVTSDVLLISDSKQLSGPKPATIL
jgi:serine/threonine protein kinase/Tol biopolymer transport system component